MPTVLDAGAMHLAGQLSEPALIFPHVGELANEIEIFNDESSLVRIAASAAFIHNTTALKAADGGPITAIQFWILF